MNSPAASCSGDDTTPSCIRCCPLLSRHMCNSHPLVSIHTSPKQLRSHLIKAATSQKGGFFGPRLRSLALTSSISSNCSLSPVFYYPYIQLIVDTMMELELPKSHSANLMKETQNCCYSRTSNQTIKDRLSKAGSFFLVDITREDRMIIK